MFFLEFFVLFYFFMSLYSGFVCCWMIVLCFLHVSIVSVVLWFFVCSRLVLYGGGVVKFRGSVLDVESAGGVVWC